MTAFVCICIMTTQTSVTILFTDLINHLKCQNSYLSSVKLKYIRLRTFQFGKYSTWNRLRFSNECKQLLKTDIIFDKHNIRYLKTVQHNGWIGNDKFLKAQITVNVYYKCWTPHTAALPLIWSFRTEFDLNYNGNKLTRMTLNIVLNIELIK